MVMPENNLSEDVLIARAAASHIQDGRQPNPCLRRSRTLELDDHVWVELRGELDETIAFYKLTPTGQLRRQ
jgi:hypothetical protein